MSMTGKTSNELFPVGQNTDTVSIFDINVITEKADALIHELQGKDSLTARELEEVKTKLTQLTQGLTTVTQTAGTNATNIASLQNSIDSLNKSLTAQTAVLTKAIITVGVTTSEFSVNANGFETISIDVNRTGYIPISVIECKTNNVYFDVTAYSFENNRLYFNILNTSNILQKGIATIKVVYARHELI